MLNNTPGLRYTPGAPRYNPADECRLCGMSPFRGLCPAHGATIGECDESPVVFCERCREELDVDHVVDDGLHFHAGCLDAVIAEEEARRVA